MHAVVIDAGRWRHDDVPVPAVGTREVLVRVRAAGLNRADATELDGGYTARSRGPGARIAGSDVAGTVEEMGAGVHCAAAGDPVCAMVEGAFAEYVTVDHRLLLPVPPRMGWAEAAALPSALLTEHDAVVTQGRLRPGAAVLVTGATSGVGQFGAQLARWAGARPVLGTTSRAANAPALAERGIIPVVTSDGDVTGTVLGATGGRGADLVVDHVGGDLLDELVAATRVGGSIIQVGRLAGSRSTLDVDRLARRRVTVIGTSFRTRDDDQRARIVAAALAHVGPAIADGSLTLPVGRVLPLDDAADALDLLRAGSGTGKIVLALDRAVLGG